MQGFRIEHHETLQAFITIIISFWGLACYGADSKATLELEPLGMVALRNTEVDGRLHSHISEKVVPDCYQSYSLFRKAKDLRIGRDLEQARTFFEEIIDRINFYLSIIDLPYEENRSRSALALIERGEMNLYRKENTFDIPRNKRLLEAYLKDILALTYNELAIVAWWDGRHLLAKCSYLKAAYFGHPDALTHIGELYMQDTIVLTKRELSCLPLEQQFFILCKKKGWDFPLNKHGFQFGYRTSQVTYAGQIIEDAYGLYAQKLEVEVGGVLSFPIIWVSEKEGLDNRGKIRAQLLVVGKKKVLPRRKEGSARSSSSASSSPVTATTAAAAVAK